MSVPIVDLSPFTSGHPDDEKMREAAGTLAKKLHQGGYVGISGHGVPPELLQQAFDMSKKFFDLPYEDKMKAPHPDGTVPHRGYSGIGREKGYAKTAREKGNDSSEDPELGLTDYKVSRPSVLLSRY